MADKTIGELPEARIGSLPLVPDLYDDAWLVVEYQGEAWKMTGLQWKKYAQASVSKYIDAAQDAADKAAGAVNAVTAAANEAKGHAESAAASADKAEQYSGKPPVIKDGTWWTWNADKQIYVDTGEAARGNLMYAVFYLDPASGELYMVTDREYTGPGFRLADGNLEVVLNYES